MNGKRRRGRLKTPYSGNITQWMSESMGQIASDSRNRAGWRSLVRHERLIITPDGTAKEDE